MPIVLKHIDHHRNVHYLTRSDKGGVSLTGETGIALSLAYEFGDKVTSVQMELEEQVTPDTFLAVAKKHCPHGSWTIQPSIYDPAKTTVPLTTTVGYADGMGNKSYVRKTENGRVYLVSENGIALSLSNIVMKEAPGIAHQLSLCKTSKEMCDILRPVVYNPGSLRPYPDRERQAPVVSPEMEEALRIVAALLDDQDGSAAEAAEDLLSRYGFDAPGIQPKPKASRRPR
nr:hypothetical protein [Neorhizobium tomejilense]